MAPQVKDDIAFYQPEKGYTAPVYIVYEKILKLFYDDDGKVKERFLEAKIDIIGDSPVDTSTDLYNQLSIAKEWGLNPIEWESLKKERKAELMAHYYCASMVQVVERFYQYKRRKLKERDNKNGQK